MFEFKAEGIFLVLTEQIAKPLLRCVCQDKNISPGPLGIKSGQVRPRVL